MTILPASWGVGLEPAGVVLTNLRALLASLGVGLEPAGVSLRALPASLGGLKMDGLCVEPAFHLNLDPLLRNLLRDLDVRGGG